MAVNSGPGPQDRATVEPTDALPHLRWPARLTRAGMVAERLTRAFWPVWTILFVAIAPFLMGWQDGLPVEAVWTWVVLAALAGLAAVVRGLMRLRWPSHADALARLDATLPGRPIAAVRDRQAIGDTDPASRAVWAAHLARMARRTRDARASPPDLRIATRDPFGLRYMAVLMLAVALLFGSYWRAGQVIDGPSEPSQLATGPTWEGWIEPPAWTGLPTLYLADLPPGRIALMAGSEITLRLYGDPGALIVDETVSGRTGEVASAADAAQKFTVTQGGRLAIAGDGGAEWQVSLLPDTAPTVDLSGPIEASALGEITQPFAATDDYGVTAGTATITLDLAAVNRAHGLVPDPDPRGALVVDLPMPFTGDRTQITEALIDDFSQHPFANLPVTLTLSVTDAAGQTGQSVPQAMTLPGRRFFQPVARAVIEQRRDLLWSRANAPRVVQLMRAITHRPDTLFTSETIYLRARHILRRLDVFVTEGTLTPAAQDEIALALWDLAVLLEEGTLADARERLQRAQERLSEAMRNGASPEEIAELMDELREATDDYLDMLAQNAAPMENQTDEPDRDQAEAQQITDDQIQQMMDEIQRLMEEGRMAEAEQLMEELNALMENLQMQMTEGGEGSGRRRPGEQAMEDLGETLRDQQELSDDAFRELQEQFNGTPPDQPGQQPQDGGQPQGQQTPGEQSGEQPGGQTDQPPGDQPGSDNPDGENPGGDEEGTLADRQQALRDELERQRGNLPGLTGEAAQAARDALEQAEGAMDRAEGALEQGNLAEAIDNQAQAMDALRQGLRDLGEALAENQSQDDQDESLADGAQAQGRTEPARRDPLGRQMGEQGQFGADQNMLQGEDIYRRAEELLQELRRRAGQQERPDLERDYLRRLLDRF